MSNFRIFLISILSGIVVGLIVFVFHSEDLYYLCQFLISTTAVYVVAGLILAFGAIFASCYWLQTQALKKHLQEAIQIIRNNSTSETFDWDRIVEEVQSLPGVNAAFNAFSANLNLYQKETLPPQLKSTSPLASCAPSEDFFNAQTLYTGQFRVDFYRSVPGILTGLGLLFTFVGLAAGIYLAYNAEGRTNLDNAINELLSGAGQAFVSSIAGLVASLLFQGYIKFSEYSVDRRIDALNELLHQNILTITSEQLQLRMLEQLNNQSALISSLSEDWQLKMQSVFEQFMNSQKTLTDDLRIKLVDAITSIDKSIKTMSENQATQISGVLENASAAFSEKLAAKMESLTQVFSETAGSLKDAAQTLDNVFATINQRITSLAEQTQKHMDSFEGQFEQVALNMKSGHAKLQDALEKAKQQIDAMSATVTETSAHCQKVLLDTMTVFDEKSKLQIQSVEQMQTLSQTLGTEGKHLQEMFAGLQERQEAFYVSTKAVGITLQKASASIELSQQEVSKNLQQAMQKLLDNAQELKEQQQSIVSNAQQVEEITAEHLSDIALNLKSMHDQIGKVLDAADNGLATAVGSMSSALNSWIEQQNGANQQLTERIEDLRQTLKVIPVTATSQAAA